MISHIVSVSSRLLNTLQKLSVKQKNSRIDIVADIYGFGLD